MTASSVCQYVILCFKAVIIIVNLIKINKCPLYQRFIFSLKVCKTTFFLDIHTS